jgi:hypothetical protein
VPASPDDDADHLDDAAHHHEQQQQHGDDVEDATEDEDEEEEGLINSDSPGKEQRQQQQEVEHGYPQNGSCGGMKRQRLGFDSPAAPNSQPHALADILNQQHQQLGGSAGAGKACGAGGGGSFGVGSFVFEHNVAGSDRDDSAFD